MSAFLNNTLRLFSSSPLQQISLFLLSWSCQTPSLPSSIQTQTLSPPPSNPSMLLQTVMTRVTAKVSNVTEKYPTSILPLPTSTASPMAALRTPYWMGTWAWWPRPPSPSPQALLTAEPPCFSENRKPVVLKNLQGQNRTELMERRGTKRASWKRMKMMHSWAPNPSCQWWYRG